ncbi:hypothetical protein [uncultured Pyramidobacter sp.]|uniref:hypothetical protein n=1 Tax=uncultured Pyramidobacter sp. TaxID=1623495 RepID=UPI002804F262|nr:hypothetical protein [uncultured Pyramidobacter sp.]
MRHFNSSFASLDAVSHFPSVIIILDFRDFHGFYPLNTTIPGKEQTMRLNQIHRQSPFQIPMQFMAASNPVRQKKIHRVRRVNLVQSLDKLPGHFHPVSPYGRLVRSANPFEPLAFERRKQSLHHLQFTSKVN